MDSEQDKVTLSSSDKITSIFSEFMMRIAKFDELVEATYRFLSGVRQELGLLKRPQLYNTSKVVDQIIETNQTDRMKAYIEAGCRHHYNDFQNISKLNTCMQGLQDHLNKVKPLLDELECLKEDAIGVAKKVGHNDIHSTDTSAIDVEDFTIEEYDRADAMLAQDKLISYAAQMVVIYNMLKLDHSMQETIINSINLTATTSEQLENYCLMWNLRPYINDNVMRQSWKLVSR